MPSTTKDKKTDLQSFESKLLSAFAMSLATMCNVRNTTIFRVFQWLSLDQFITDMDQTIVLLVGRMSDDDVDISKPYAATIKGFARLALIGLQDSVKIENLQQLADYSYVLDLNKPIPSNIQDIISQAYGC